MVLIELGLILGGLAYWKNKEDEEMKESENHQTRKEILKHSSG